jgi:ankyrin repeat protein
MFKSHLEQKLINFAYAGNIEQVKALMDEEIDPSSQNNKAFWSACAMGHVEMVKFLLNDKRVYPSASRNAAFIIAAERGHLEVVKLLLADIRVNPADNHNAAINSAVRNGHYEIVKLLVADKRVDPSDNNNLATRRASEKGNVEILQLLFAYAMNVCELKFNEVFRAASVGFLKKVHKNTTSYINDDAAKAIAKKHASLIENHGWDVCSEAICAKKTPPSIHAISFLCKDFSAFIGNTYPTNENFAEAFGGSASNVLN